MFLTECLHRFQQLIHVILTSRPFFFVNQSLGLLSYSVEVVDPFCGGIVCESEVAFKEVVTDVFGCRIYVKTWELEVSDAKICELAFD